MNYILEEMNKVDADGVDFVPIWFDESSPPPIICSYTKKELQNVKSYPKSNRVYWKMIEGKKRYVNNNKSESIATTPEYFSRVLADEINVQKAIDFLNKLGIQVKTECGNYRPTYDVLRDIGDAMSRC